MRMRGNEHSRGSTTPWKGTDCGTFGGLRQFIAEFVYFGSCLSHLSLGGGNEALLFLLWPWPYKLQQQFFYPQPPWPLCPLRPSAQLEAGFWWCCKHRRKLDKGRRKHGSRVAQGKIILKNILDAVSTESSDTEVAVNQPEEVRLPLLAVASVGERSRRTVVGMVREGLKQTRCQEQCELTEEVVVWCCVCQHTAVKMG
jgi:hypothetical protein